MKGRLKHFLPSVPWYLHDKSCLFSGFPWEIIASKKIKYIYIYVHIHALMGSFVYLEELCVNDKHHNINCLCFIFWCRFWGCCPVNHCVQCKHRLKGLCAIWSHCWSPVQRAPNLHRANKDLADITWELPFMYNVKWQSHYISSKRMPRGGISSVNYNLGECFSYH